MDAYRHALAKVLHKIRHEMIEEPMRSPPSGVRVPSSKCRLRDSAARPSTAHLRSPLSNTARGPGDISESRST